MELEFEIVIPIRYSKVPHKDDVGYNAMIYIPTWQATDKWDGIQRQISVFIHETMRDYMSHQPGINPPWIYEHGYYRKVYHNDSLKQLEEVVDGELQRLEVFFKQAMGNYMYDKEKRIRLKFKEGV